MLQRLERDTEGLRLAPNTKGQGCSITTSLPGTLNSECKITDTPGTPHVIRMSIILPQEETRPNIWSSSRGDHQVPFQGSPWTAWLCRQTQASAGTTHAVTTQPTSPPVTAPPTICPTSRPKESHIQTW